MTRGDPLTDRSSATLTACIVVLSAAHLALAAWAAIDAASFTTALADFGPPNPHLIHDFAACAATFGVGLAVAVRLPGWRMPALALAAVWNGLHDISHVIDIAHARPVTSAPSRSSR